MKHFHRRNALVETAALFLQLRLYHARALSALPVGLQYARGNMREHPFGQLSVIKMSIGHLGSTIKTRSDVVLSLISRRNMSPKQ